MIIRTSIGMKTCTKARQCRSNVIFACEIRCKGKGVLKSLQSSQSFSPNFTIITLLIIGNSPTLTN